MVSERQRRLEVETRAREDEDQSWFALTMEAPLWMAVTAVVLSILTVVVMWVLVSS